MLQQWHILVAQIVNFLILVALLKWLLFDRIVKAMDQREEKIASRLKQAEQERQDAEQEAEAYRQKNRELDEQREQKLDEAKQQAQQRRKQLVGEARQEVDELKDRWKAALEEDQQELIRQLRTRAAEAFDEAVRGALADLAGAELEQQVASVFLERLDNMQPAEHDAFAEAIRTSETGVTIASTWKLPQSLRKQIGEALHRHFEDDFRTEFVTCSELICGVELQAGGRAVGWNLDSYLGRLAQSIRDSLQEQTESTESTEDTEDSEGP